MELLTLANNQLQISPYSLTIDEFRAIWNRDNSQTKDMAIKELSFVYFMCDYKSTFRGYEPVYKELKIKEELHLGGWNPDTIVKAAIVKFNALQETPSMRLLKMLEDSLVKIESFIKGYNPAQDLTGAKFRALASAIKAAPDIFKSINSIREIVEQEVMTAKRVRGGHSTGKREIPRGKRLATEE